MQFKDRAIIYKEVKEKDGFGGYVLARQTLCEIKCKVAPYRVEVGQIVEVPNPTASVKFFTKDKLNFDEDIFFYIEYNGKKYKKVLFADYVKCVMIIGERV